MLGGRLFKRAQRRLRGVVLVLEVQPHPLVGEGGEARVTGDRARELPDVVCPVLLFP